MIGKIKSFFKKNDGATAVEFSLLVMPFMLVVLGILEISLMFLSAAIVEGATDSASRIIRTGQLQKDGGDPETLFRDALCSFTGALVNCGDMAVEVVRMDSYFDFTQPVYDGDGNLVPQGFDAGGSNDKVMIRVAWRYSMITPLVGDLLNGADGSTLFVSTIVLQSEPYEFQGV